jgi:hypothetical protein
MKPLLLVLVFISSVSLITSSCKKKDAEKTTAQKLQNKWVFVNATDNNHYSGADHVITVSGNTGDYFDFRTDGKLYLRVQSSPDTSTYVLLGDTKIIFDGTDTATIQTLTDNALKLYFKDVTTPSIYEEIIYNLSR